MDFDRLPTEIFLHIFQLLPFKERIRIASVSSQFKMISETAISLTKGLNLTAAIFREAKLKSMEKLFLCCAANQKKVIVDFPYSSYGRRSEMLERLRVFTNISHPRLEAIKLDTRNGTEQDYNMVRDLLVNHTNIRSLSWNYPNGPFPNVLCEKLESVKVYDMCMYDHAYFASITDYCPNVKNLVLAFKNRYDFNWETGGEILQQWQEILNNIFANTPAMQSLELLSWNINLLEIKNVWKLASLRMLILSDWVSVPLLEKISATFPLLENFEFWSDWPMPIEGASALQRLKNLHWVLMAMRDRNTKDAYALQLATCHRLQFVLINESTQSPIVTAFVKGCPQLQVLQMWSMNDIKSPESAISFVKSLDGFVQENLKIETNGEVWQSADVQAAVAEVNKSKGHQISIKTTFSSFRYLREPYRAPTAECTTDRDSLRPPWRPSLWQRLIMWIKDLQRKIVNMFW